MHPLLRPAYAAGTTLAEWLVHVAPASDSKLWRSFRARRGVLDRWTAKASAVRDPSRPLVWLHAPSVGEGLQARPIAHALRATRPEVQQAYSLFSPSAERFAASIGAEITDYLPFDGVGAAERMLDALRPNVIVFSKLDVWPNLVARAHARGVRVAMLSATLAEGSGRRSAWSRALLHDAYAMLDTVGAIDEANGERLLALGVRRDALHITGDTRFDQVWQRAQQVDRSAPLLRGLMSDRQTLVAGSTWPADEAVLLPAWQAVRAQLPTARLIIAPHEPTASHLEPIERWARQARLTCTRLGILESAPDLAAQSDVVLVDRVGVLGDLYALASAAYVGGGFHAAGLHSAIEPAAFGAPVAFGPSHHMSREAGLLLAGSAAQSARTVSDLTEVLTGWLQSPESRHSAGAAAQQVVRRELGATSRSVALVERLLVTE